MAERTLMESEEKIAWSVKDDSETTLKKQIES